LFLLLDALYFAVRDERPLQEKKEKKKGEKKRERQQALLLKKGEKQNHISRDNIELSSTRMQPTCSLDH